jgi:hypothetical protein
MTKIKSFDYINKAPFDNYLLPQLDSLVYNIKNDWDFVILITGNRQVRTGKSVLGQNVAKYLSVRIGSKFDENNIFLQAKEMMKESFKMPKNSILVYDEGAESLRKGNSFTNFQYNLINYFNEVGQMNHIFIIILPDFFDLTEQIAVARSEFLINVYRTETKKLVDQYNEGVKRPVVEFGRGRFTFFNRERKQKLYDLSISSKKKSYGLVKANFFGSFEEYYPVDEAKYRQKKMESFQRFQKRQKENRDLLRDKAIMKMYQDGFNAVRISEYFKDTFDFNVTPRYINYIIQRNINPVTQEEDLTQDEN